MICCSRNLCSLARYVACDRLTLQSALLSRLSEFSESSDQAVIAI